MTHYIINLSGDDDTGYEADLLGIYQPKPAAVISWSLNHIAIKQAGYSENPGSRYSGLMSYYPPEITVYEIIERDGLRLKVKGLTGWETRRKSSPVKAPRAG